MQRPLHHRCRGSSPSPSRFAIPTPSDSAPPAPKGVRHAPAGLELATFAGGCFWSMEYDFDKLAGVKQTISGFMGGKTPNPTYAQVSHRQDGHAESVQVTMIRRSSATRSWSTTTGITSTCSTAAASSATAATSIAP